ncbi:MAG: hypothetical protein HY653_06435 [Acidobacteria bacterium]|nr:hypothetical protein [Acidobacteriota bacterium]
MKSLEERIERATRGGPSEITTLIYDNAVEVLEALLRNPFLSEDHLLLLLSRKELPREVLQSVADHREWVKSYPVKLALVRHPKAPRLVSLRLLKYLYLFDLVTVIQQPTVAAEIKRVAEDNIINRLEQIPLGQRITLARRASARVVAALLALGDAPLLPVALDSPQLTEGVLVRLLQRHELPLALVEEIARHPKWSLRYDIRLALVRHPLTPLARVLAFLPELTPQDLLILATDTTMPAERRAYVEELAGRRLRPRSRSR